MNSDIGTLLIVFVVICLLLVSAMKKKWEWLLNVVMRSVMGTIVIYFVNLALGGMGISLGVGINTVTVLTSGILGFPGVVALYGIGIYQLL
uniref:pro-sigmaK processing inhibitor BofA family protein n=1 Tax=Acetatifactor sp. TaxID=1872090 RepID=UPI004057C99B